MPMRRWLLSSWPPIIATGLYLTVLLGRHDVPVLTVLVYAAYLVVAVCVPGVVAWRWLVRPALETAEGPRTTWFQDASLGTIFGFGVQLPTYLLGVWVGWPYLFLVAAAVIVLASVLTPGGRALWTQPTARLDARASWCLAALIAYGSTWLATNMFPRQPLSWPRNRTPFLDEGFHQALIGELMHRFPPHVPFVAGNTLDYQWFVHGQLAATVWTTRIDTLVLLRQLFPVAMVALTVLGLAACALYLTRRPVTAVVAPALLVVGGFNLIGPHYDREVLAEPYLMDRLVFSPTFAYGVTVSVMALVPLLAVLDPARRPSRRLWAGLVIALLLLSGAKATFLPVFVCAGIGLWVLLLLQHRRIHRPASYLLAVLVGCTLFAQFVLLGGNGGGMAVVPFRTVRVAVHQSGIPVTTVSMAAMTLALLIGWLLYGTGAIGLLRHGLWKDPRTLWMLITIPTGVTVPLVLYRSGWSQLWFQRSVAPIVVLLSAWGLAQLLPQPLRARTAASLGAVAVASGLAVFWASSRVEAGKKDVGAATLEGLVLTVAVPAALLLCYLLAAAVLRFRRGPGDVPRRPWLVTTIFVVVVLGLGLTHAWTLVHDKVTDYPSPGSDHPGLLYARGGYPAARYIDEHSDPDDVVATNVHCRHPQAERCDNRNFWVSGYTRRQVVIEGWGYTARTNDQGTTHSPNAFLPNPYTTQLRINDAAFESPSLQTLGRLVSTYSVDWLFVDKRYPVDLEGLAQLPALEHAYENRNYVVYRVAGQ